MNNTNYSMIDRWNIFYRNQSPFRYGDSDLSYVKAAQFLDGLPLVEDWGCGSMYAKQFFNNSVYYGIDGSHSLANIKADLQTYHSNPDGLLMRGVLEHNRNWEAVLKNAIASFRVRMCLIHYLEFVDKTREYHTIQPEGIPEMLFKKTDITDHFVGMRWYEEFLPTKETVFYLEKICRQS